jgi:hypothetical protein
LNVNLRSLGRKQLAVAFMQCPDLNYFPSFILLLFDTLLLSRLTANFCFIVSTGTHWVYVGLGLKVVDAYDASLFWGVSPTDNIYRGQL